MPIDLFAISPTLDIKDLAARFAQDGRIQIRDVLTESSAKALHEVLSRQTPWGLAWRAGNDGPHGLKADELARLSGSERAAISTRIQGAMQGREYAFSYARYPILDAYLERWMPGGAFDILLEHLNAEPFITLARDVTGVAGLKKADAQATLFAPNQFLPLHSDSHMAEGWRIAYVLSLCADDWRPDWGGYLQFFDEDGDIVAGYRPRFNALSMFAVPAAHAVSYVPPFAPVGRFSITGWLRDR